MVKVIHVLQLVVGTRYLTKMF